MGNDWISLLTFFLLTLHNINGCNSTLAPPYIKNDFPNEIWFFDKYGFELDCEGTGSSEVSYKWVQIDATTRISKPPAILSQEQEWSSVGKRIIFKQEKVSKTSQNTYQCVASNVLGTAYSKKILIRQVPYLSDLEIRYEAPEVEVGTKAIISCQPKRDFLKPFYRIKSWTISQGTSPLLTTIDKTNGRYSMINSLSVPELHIDHLTEDELDQGLFVSCQLESRVPEADLTVIDNDQSIQIRKPVIHGIPASITTRTTFVRANLHENVELPCPLIGGNTNTVKWTWYPLNSNSEQKIPDGTYEIINGNLLIINANISQAGRYVCSSPSVRGKAEFHLNYKSKIEVKLDPEKQYVDIGEKVILECSITGMPINKTYWLFNGKLLNEISRSLKIDSFKIDDVGVYQCFAEAYRDNDKETGVDSYLLDNAQATAHLLLNGMRPILQRQSTSENEEISGTEPVTARITQDLDELRLECIFASNPPSNVKWFRDDDLLIFNQYYNTVEEKLFSNSSHPYTTTSQIIIRPSTMPIDYWILGGEYRALASNEFGEGDCKTIVLVEGKGLQIRPLVEPYPSMEQSVVVESEQSAIDGRSHEMRCYTIGPSIPNIQWTKISKDGSTEMIPIHHRHSLKENNRVFIINPVKEKEKDSAKYRCRATLPSSYDSSIFPIEASSYVNLIVQNPPVIGFQGDKHIATPGQLYHFTCFPQSGDRPWYAWLEFQPEPDSEIDLSKPKTILLLPNSDIGNLGFEISYANESKKLPISDKIRDLIPNFVHDRANQVVSVKIAMLNKSSHRGNLSCVVRNTVDVARHTVKLEFKPEFAFAIKPDNSMVAIINQSISAHCQPKKGLTDARVEWEFKVNSTEPYQLIKYLKEDQKKRIKQLENGTLYVSNVHEDDPRQYLCFIRPIISTNGQDAISSALNLDVKVPARIDVMEDLVKTRDSHFNIKCAVHGEIDERKVLWQFRHNLWPKELGFVSFEIERVKSSSFQAECIFDISEHDYLKKNRKVPCNLIEPFHDSYYQEVAGRTRFKIIGQSDDKSVKLYKLEMEISDANDNHIGDYRCLARNAHNFNKTGWNNLVEFNDTFWVESKFSLSVIGPPSEPRIETTNSTSTSISIWWKPPVDNGHRPITKYLIDFGVSSSNKLENIEVSKDILHHTIDGLLPYTNYSIFLLAVNEAGKGRKVTKSYSTDQAKPGTHVGNLVCSSQSSSSLLVKWRPIADSLTNGPILQHWLCWTNVTSNVTMESLINRNWPYELSENQLSSYGSTKEEYNSIWCITMSADTTEYEVPQLPAFTFIGIRVMVRNSKGLSPPDFCYNYTQEALPSESPENLRCSEISFSSMTVNWNPPKSSKLNGILEGYQLFYFPEGDESQGNETKLIVPPMTYLRGLKAFTNYTIIAYVLNSKGLGPPSKPINCITKETRPSPPRNVRAFKKGIDISCALLTWSPPAYPNGRLISYRIFLVDAKVFLDKLPTDEMPTVENIKSVQEPARLSPKEYLFGYEKHQICALEPSIDYYFLVMAVTESRLDSKLSYSNLFNLRSNNPAIISIGGLALIPQGAQLRLDCELSSSHERNWISNPPELFNDKTDFLENGSLIIKSMQKDLEGEFLCLIPEMRGIPFTNVTYKLQMETPKLGVIRSVIPHRKSIYLTWTVPRIQNDNITGFELNFISSDGLFHHETLDSSVRSYFLSQLSCATRFEIKLETFTSERKRYVCKTDVFTLGKIPSLMISEQSNIDSQEKNLVYVPEDASSYVLFNLSRLIIGHECPPTKYHLVITTAEDRNLVTASDELVRRPRESQNTHQIYDGYFTGDDLISLDPSNPSQRFYKNITNLSPSSHYKHNLFASNPAGEFNSSGMFQTRSARGSTTHLFDNSLIGQKQDRFSSTSILIFVIIPICVCLILVIFAYLFIRQRRLKSSLQAKTSRRIVLPHDPSTGKPIISTNPEEKGFFTKFVNWLTGSDGQYSRGQKSDQDTDSIYDQIKYYGIYKRPMTESIMEGFPQTAPPDVKIMHHPLALPISAPPAGKIQSTDPFIRAVPSSSSRMTIDSRTLGRANLLRPKPVMPFKENNGTVHAMLDMSFSGESATSVSLYKPARRVNSMESLNQCNPPINMRMHSQAQYHQLRSNNQGFLTTSSLYNTGNANGIIYDPSAMPIFRTDGREEYNQSIVSSNHEELVQAYKNACNNVNVSIGNSRFARPIVQTNRHGGIIQRQESIGHYSAIDHSSGWTSSTKDQHFSALINLQRQPQRNIRQMPLPEIPRSDTIIANGGFDQKQIVSKASLPHSARLTRKQLLNVNPEFNGEELDDGLEDDPNEEANYSSVVVV